MRPVAEVAADVTIAEVVAVDAVVVAVDAVVVVAAAGPRAEHKHKSGSYAEETYPQRLSDAGSERISQPLHPKLFYQELAR